MAASLSGVLPVAWPVARGRGAKQTPHVALPALPLPTGAVSHVLEILTMLLALELVVGRTEVWIPDRFRDRELKGLSGPKFSRVANSVLTATAPTPPSWRPASSSRPPVFPLAFS